jgi:beta-mannanase
MFTTPASVPGFPLLRRGIPGISALTGQRDLLRTLLFLVLLSGSGLSHAQVIKSVIYDFDGFDLGSTSLPEGDYSYGDLSYQVAANPLAASDVLGDRVLQMDIAWNNGYGAFGRGISRYVELSGSQDRLNFYFYNPLSNAQSASVQVTIADDDNQSNVFESASDDQWRSFQTIPGAAGWQLVSIPLSSFNDDNTGGNGVFDIAFTQNNGMLLLVEMRFNKPSAATTNPRFYLDFICLTEGQMPKGNNILNPPAKQPGDHCLLGAHQYEDPGKYYLIPQHFEGLFTPAPGKRLRYVNTYMQWATNGGTQPHMLPGQGYQTLLDNGYRPIITWEPSFSGLSISDPAQPSLSDIIAGTYDSYIDDFGDKLKTYDDTIIVRLMHEFDGDWYPWCVANNQQDPQLFISAWQHIVDRVRNRGAGKVKWMWCPNNSITPQASWNWVVSAYPGNSYVDIVATDVYNAHYPASLPWWRSFRWQTAEIYYYLTKYFPTKPFFLCELASRERESSEPQASQTKAGWFAMMDKDLQSYFRKTRALIFFNETKGQTWSITSSNASLNSLATNVWADDYYFFPNLPSALRQDFKENQSVHPNPTQGEVVFVGPNAVEAQIFDLSGKHVLSATVEPRGSIDLTGLNPGIYFLQYNPAPDAAPVTIRLIKQ